MLVEIPRELLHMALFTPLVCLLCDLDGNLVFYWLTLFLATYAGGTFGMLIGVVSKTTNDAAQLVPAAMIPLLVFSDGMVSVKSLPAIVQWMAFVDPLYFLLRCFYIIEFSGVSYPTSWNDDQAEICQEYNLLNGSAVEALWREYNVTNFLNDSNDSCALY